VQATAAAKMATTEKSASELKQQGAIEAAQDPESKVTPADAQKKIVEESKNAGVAAFTFDPNATIAEKKAQVKAVSTDFLPPGHHHLPIGPFWRVID
jgi:hypothetical protein